MYKFNVLIDGLIIYTQYSNGLSKSFNSGCLVSFSLSMAWSEGMRQSMPSDWSRMLMPPSDSG